MRSGATSILILFLAYASVAQRAWADAVVAAPPVTTSTRAPVESVGERSVPDALPPVEPSPQAIRASQQFSHQPRVQEGVFQPPALQRLVDLELIFPGFPDFIGGALEVNPLPWLSVEVGGATLFGMYTSAFLDVKSRMLRYSSFQLEGNQVRSGFEFGLGPSLGVRGINGQFAFCSQAPCSGRDTFVIPDVMLSIETVWWFSSEFGFSLQLDGGFLGGRLSFGLALATPLRPSGG